MLKIRFILLFGIILGGALSVAVIKGRGHGVPELKKSALENSAVRRPSQE
ncbi:MAG: hypothetical protein ACXWQO_07585 [Bdellovibrionota bacterium]